LKLADYQRLAEDQFNYGVQFFIGDGILMNKSQSICYFKSSADQRHTEFQFRDAIRLLIGDGLSINESQSACHFKLTADQEFMIVHDKITNCFGMMVTFEWTN
jgi:TPR repeat protein